MAWAAFNQLRQPNTYIVVKPAFANVHSKLDALIERDHVYSKVLGYTDATSTYVGFRLPGLPA